MTTKNKLLMESGTFAVGTNYWASHAGTAMWSDWRPDVVERDLQALAEAGLQILRVFLLWPDFQPLTQLYTGEGQPAEIRNGEDPFPDTAAGRAGVSAEAVRRFREFTDIADRHGLKLIVGLVTGWMSGRLFVPPALEGRNVLTDPVALMWEVRLVQFIVRHFLDDPAILAWDLGNECNVMAPVPGHEAAWTWTATIVNSIRAVDPQRPIISGMHSLSPQGKWTMQDQGELTDLLTTHPYPVFTPHCNQDPVNTIRTQLHATSESLFYADLGHKPCFAEELGTLGPMVCSEEIAAQFIRAGLFSLWAHDLRGLLWWCAADQTQLPHAPYDWYAMERELGLLRVDGTPKPVLGELGRFARFISGLPLSALPQRVKEGVCILSDAQDQWGVAYSAFVLAKQAGFDLEYQYEAQPLKPAQLYLLPCITGHQVVNRRNYLELMARVADGATLYISYDGGFLSHFEELTGLKVLTRSRRAQPVEVAFDGIEPGLRLPLSSSYQLALATLRGQVLGSEGGGNPALTCAPYGKGHVYFLGFPLESMLAATPGAFHAAQAPSYWKLYRRIAEPYLAERVVRKAHPMLGITEHPLAPDRRCVVLINYSPEAVTAELQLAAGWAIGESWYGALPQTSAAAICTVNANDAIVFTVVQR